MNDKTKKNGVGGFVPGYQRNSEVSWAQSRWTGVPGSIYQDMYGVRRLL